MEQTELLGAPGGHTALGCARQWPCVLMLFLLVIELLVPSLCSTWGFRMPPTPLPAHRIPDRGAWVLSL